MQYIFIVVFLTGVNFSVNGQALTKNFPNTENKTIAGYEALINYYKYSHQDSAIFFARQAIDFFKHNRDTNGVALMLVQLGKIEDDQGKFEYSEDKYQLSLDLFKSIHSQKGIASATIRLGVVQLRNGRYDKAIEYFLQALQVAEKSSNVFGMMEANYNISWAYLDQHNYELTLKYLTIAEQYNNLLPLSHISLNIYNHFGVVYRHKLEFEKAKQYLEKGIQLSNQPQYQGIHITLINNLAAVYSKEGFNNKAIPLQEKALTQARKIGNYLGELQTLYGLARTYGSEDPSMSIFYLTQAINLAREKKAYRQEMRYLKALTEFYKTLDKYKEALATKEREHALADSLFYKSTSIRIDSLKAAYELSKSRARIQELSYINNNNQLELEKSNMIKNVTLGGIILLIVILALLYNQYLLKQHSNSQLQIQKQVLQVRQEEINHKNISLQLLLNEKEWLLKEIHHRVKNNLQVVMSLLASQADFLKDRAALTAIQESRHRVQAIALIHQKLYQSESLARIAMRPYIEEVVAYLSDSYNLSQQVRFSLSVDAIELGLTQAVPLGLIINEAITNAFKYAFPQGGSGTISLSLHQMADSSCKLNITDDGLGLPPGYDSTRSHSLGMTLLHGLSAQIGGDLQITSQAGLNVSLVFNEEHFAGIY